MPDLDDMLITGLAGEDRLALERACRVYLKRIFRY